MTCPICSKPVVAAFKPFCSQRCADVDLSRWLRGGYAIPGQPAGEEDDGESNSPQNKAIGAADKGMDRE